VTPDILVVADAGYDGPRLAYLLRDLPVQLLARMRSDRVLRRAVPIRLPGTNGRPPRHGGEFIFGDPASCGQPDVTTMTDTRLYGPATARSWNRLHPRLTRRAAWLGSGDLPLIEGTVIRLEVARLPSGAIPKPVWLRWSGVDARPCSNRSAVAGVPAPLRHRAHLPPVQADPGLDLPTHPHPQSKAQAVFEAPTRAQAEPLVACGQSSGR